jgi:hypothetical protein|tara:strand:- start:57 stop:566 length:510 start_codon:yes stop_codon:yes gene_type:complete
MKTKATQIYGSITAVICLLISLNAVSAEQYEKGHGALQYFDAQGMSVSPIWVQAWVAFMVLTFAIGLFVFAWRQPIARWAAGGFILSASSGAAIFGALGLPFLSGAIAIMHIICWTPALVLLLTRLPFFDPEHSQAFKIWAGTLTFVISFSFIFDLRDAVIYIAHFAAA